MTFLYSNSYCSILFMFFYNCTMYKRKLFGHNIRTCVLTAKYAADQKLLLEKLNFVVLGFCFFLQSPASGCSVFSVR